MSVCSPLPPTRNDRYVIPTVSRAGSLVNDQGSCVPFGVSRNMSHIRNITVKLMFN
ncbi:hypothetical protein BN13_30105 [Nostocoides jenkinsii Ben 74]|uniref:Uncharacterized protein n=1 Tax=Nostocoides jenkinsii Ben 74 TaxID=1193518 RepID=A0A077ME59_9MICO|nr:hypothetical protein BN13_30105 [Tetrasphaera jenkinsii Ben 74]